MQNRTIQELLEEVHDWLRLNAPPLLENFNPPASREQITKAEAELQVTFSESLKQLYSIHDGESESSDGIFGAWKWLPLSKMISRQKQLIQLDKAYGFGDFKNGLIAPLIESGGGDFLYVESVSESKEECEILEWQHEMPRRDVKFASLRAFLENFVSDLKAGKYVYLPEHLNALIDRDDL